MHFRDPIFAPRPYVSVFVCFLAALLAARPSVCQTEDLAAQRMAHLRRGVNTSEWFAQSPGNYSVERLRAFTTLDDISRIHTLGFDHIRLSVDAAPLTLWQQGTPAGKEFMAELDRVVEKATSEDLAVIVDVHPEDSYKKQLFEGTESVERFDSLWTALATHFRDTDPRLVFFEIMNESEQSDPQRWRSIETQAAQAIRAVAPGHSILASGAHWSGLDDLLKLEPLPLENIIYTFHDYEPFPFTHQGATWTMTEVRPLRGVPYPSTPENITPLLSQEPTLADRLWLEQYGLAQWNASRVNTTVDFADQWSRLHHVPVYCGEFGVYRAFAPPAARAQWIRDMRTALESHSIGWAMWDYQQGFSLVTKRKGEVILDRAVLNALGLGTSSN